MARTSKTSPFKPREQPEPRANVEGAEEREVAQTEPKTDDEESNSIDATISNVEEAVSGRKRRRTRSLEELYSATQSIEGNLVGIGNKSEIDSAAKPKRGRGRPRGGKTKRGRGRARSSKTKALEIDVNAKLKRGRGRPRGSKQYAGEQGKGKKQEQTDVSEDSEPDLEEGCKGFKGRYNDDDSDDDDGTGGGGEADKNLSNLGPNLLEEAYYSIIS